MEVAGEGKRVFFEVSIVKIQSAHTFDRLGMSGYSLKDKVKK
jgi:hypothetical protein